MMAIIGMCRGKLGVAVGRALAPLGVSTIDGKWPSTITMIICFMCGNVVNMLIVFEFDLSTYLDTHMDELC